MTDANRKINELRREMQRLYEEVKTLKVDIEPGGQRLRLPKQKAPALTVGHISEGFDRLSEDMDHLRNDLNQFKSEMRKEYHQLSHQINQVLARQEVMLEAFTKLSDLPEE